MKFLKFFLIVFSVALAEKSPLYTGPGEVTADTYGQLDRFVKFKSGERIANGIEAKKGEINEFCYLSITFVNKQITCGCYLVSYEYVATSARCLADCSEKGASNITVTFPSASGADAVKTIKRFIIPDGANGNMALPAYSELSEIPYTTIGDNNIGLIQLSVPFPPGTTSVKPASIASEESMGSFLNRMQKEGYRFRACGIGVIDDKGTRPKGVMCTDMNYVDPMLCAETFDRTRVYTIPASTMCLQWPDRTNNACIGDFGGPVYAYKLDVKGVLDVASQEVFCTLIGSPNLRSASPCLDGHITVCTFVAGPSGPGTMGVHAWAYNVINNVPPT